MDSASSSDPSNACDSRASRGKLLILPYPALGALALLAYLLLRQDAFYKGDGSQMVIWLTSDRASHMHHLLYFPIAQGLDALLRPLGFAPFVVLGIYSAIATSAGLLLVYAGMRQLGMRCGGAMTAALLVGACPAVAFFATVVEFHGVFFFFAALVFFCFARLKRRARVLDAAIFALAVGLSFAAHATGILLPLLLLPWYLVWGPREEFRRRLRLGLLAGIGTALVVLGVSSIARSMGGGHAIGNSLALLLGDPARRFELLPRIAYGEFLRPFLPLSLVYALALFHPATRREAWSLLVGLLAYLGICLLLLGDVVCEQGAYLLPLAIPLAALARRLLPSWAIAVLLLGSGALSFLDIREHDRPISALTAYARGFEEATDGVEHSVLWIGGGVEYAACAHELPDLQIYLLDWITRDRETVEDILWTLPQLVRHHEREGKVTYITTAALDLLENPRVQLRKRILEFLNRTFEMTRVSARSFRAYRLRVR